MDHSAAESSTSRTRRSRPSRPSAKGSARSGSPGKEPGLGRAAIRELSSRYGIRPRKALGQNFLADPNTARRIAALSGAGPRDRILEIGAGLGSLTLALAATGADVLAVEFDRTLLPALAEVARGEPRVRILQRDAMRTDWRRLLGRGRWKMVSNLPYNVAVPLILSMLERHLPIDTYLVMVQKEVGERLAAAPGDDAYGAPSVRVAYHAQAKVLRRIPPTVFWPQPNVESVLVRIEPRERPPVDVRADALFRIVDEGFGQRRKTMRNALRRLGLTAADASEVLTGCGLAAGVRAESLGVADFACIARALEGKGLGG